DLDRIATVARLRRPDLTLLRQGRSGCEVGGYRVAVERSEEGEQPPFLVVGEPEGTEILVECADEPRAIAPGIVKIDDIGQCGQSAGVHVRRSGRHVP